MKRHLATALLLVVLTAATASGVTDVVYPAVDARASDLVELLRTALEKTVAQYGAYTLRPSRSVHMTESRYLSDLLDPAGEVNVAWSGTSEQKEQEYAVVRIPLRKGILGYRVALIARERQKDLDKINTLEDLRRLTVGQGIGWGDVSVYQANGIAVRTANYDNLFRMIAANRVDIFPLGITEVFSEYAARHASIPNLAIDDHLLIYYPWPYYFFFKKGNSALARRVEAGLRIMIRDGSYDAIFMKYNRASIQKANLHKRRIIRLQNPHLPKGTPLNDPSLWFDPAQGK